MVQTKFPLQSYVLAFPYFLLHQEIEAENYDACIFIFSILAYLDKAKEAVKVETHTFSLLLSSSGKSIKLPWQQLEMEFSLAFSNHFSSLCLPYFHQKSLAVHMPPSSLDLSLLSRPFIDTEWTIFKGGESGEINV